VPASITVDDEIFDCPPARLIIQSKDDQVVALLITDDPPNAADDGYTGNSIYLEMPLDVPETGSLAGAHWDFKASNREEVETVSGIYLHGRKKHLQPYDARTDFQTAKSPIKLTLVGTFLMFDENDDQAPGKTVQVKADIAAIVTVGSEPK